MHLSYGDRDGACAECGTFGGELLGIEWKDHSTLLLCESCALKAYCCIGLVAVYNATGKFPCSADIKRIDKVLRKRGVHFGESSTVSMTAIEKEPAP